TAEQLARAGVVVGRPATVSMVVQSQAPDDALMVPDAVATAPVPQSGRVAVGIGEKVPFDEYPLPSRPARLEVLERSSNGPAPISTLIEADGPHQTTLRWDTQL